MQEMLSVSCQCQITADSIDEESFACSEDSSNYVTYQARMSGTSEQENASLIFLIEDWVATGPTICVRGVLMRAGEECSTTISDLSEGVCSGLGAQTDAYICASTGSITGGGVAVAAALIVIVAVTVAIVTVLTIVNSHQRMEKSDFRVSSIIELPSVLVLSYLFTLYTSGHSIYMVPKVKILHPTPICLIACWNIA